MSEKNDGKKVKASRDQFQVHSEQTSFVRSTRSEDLIEGTDYYYNADGLFVFTSEFHKKRGYCCKSGCLHCPFGFETPTEDEIVEEN